MNVFEYMGWEKIFEISGKKYVMPDIDHPLDGNDIVLAINAMQKKKPDMNRELNDETDYRSDFQKFMDYTFKIFVNQTGGGTNDDRNLWLFGDPAKFFELMEEAIREGVIGKL
ncbi:MAG: hypothetical protein ABFC12_06115 [Methanobacterium sp.]